MAVILNTWVEKERRKRAYETAPSYQSDTIDTWIPVNPTEVIKRHSKAARAIWVKTLRGVRK